MWLEIIRKIFVNPRNSKAKSLVKEYLLVSFFFGLFALLAFWPAFTNITSTVPGAEGDPFYFLWSMWWINFATFNLHASPYFTSLLFYPIGHGLTTSPLPLLESFLTLPIQLVSIPAAYNFVVFISFMLSGVFAYALVKHLVKDRYAAFIGGMIYAFSPIHIAHAFAGHLNWMSVEFLPLIVLCLLLLLEEQKYKYSFFAGVSLFFVIFFGDFEQGVLALILIAVLLYFYAFIHGFRKTFTKRLLLSLFLIPLVAGLLGLPYLSQVAYSITHGSALSTFYHQSSLVDEIGWSNSLLGFFIPSYYNQIYNPIVSGGAPNFLGPFYTLTYNGALVGDNANAITQDERTSYVGYLALFLFLCGIYYDIKKKRHAGTLFWLSIFLFFSIMSFGPFLRLSNGIVAVPGPFLIYTFIPLLNIIKEPGRFFFAATIPLAVIASVGARELYGKFGLKGRQRIFATLLISVLLFLDYSGIIFPGHTQLLFLNATVPSAYQTIQGYQQNVSVLLLPSIGNSYYQEEELYYQTTFQKPLFNGYGKENLTQILHISMMPISAYGRAFEQNVTPSYQSPVNENLTLLTDTLLAKNNVGYVGVIKSAYTQPNLGRLTAYLSSLLGNPVHEDNSTLIFSTIGLPSSPDELAYYPSGTWTQGNFLCGYYQGISCNSSFSSGWWGAAQRNITIFSPSNSTVNVSFSIRSFGQLGPRAIDLYSNSASRPLYEFSISPNQTIERFQLRLSKGRNELEFSMPSLNSTDGYFTYDLHNFTIEK